MLTLIVSPETSDTLFATEKSRHIPGGTIEGFPGGIELHLRIHYSSPTLQAETSYCHQVTKWLRDHILDEHIHVLGPGDFSKVTDKDGLESTLFEALRVIDAISIVAPVA